MAKYRPGGVTNELRGSLGGSTFSRNQHGPYVYPRLEPDNTNTLRRAEIREAMTFVSDLWNTGLSDADRAAWAGFAARLGRSTPTLTPQRIGARDAFMRHNMRLYLYDATTLVTPPLLTTVTNLDTIALAADADLQTLSISFAPDPVPANHALVVWTTPSMNLGRNSPHKADKFLCYIGPAQSSPQDITTPWTTLYGAIQPSSKIFARAWLMNLTNAAYSVPQLATATVTGTGDTMQSTRIELTNDQIKALPTTPIQILPSPGTNKINRIIMLTATAKFTAPYTNVANYPLCKLRALYAGGALATQDGEDGNDLFASTPNYSAHQTPTNISSASGSTDQGTSDDATAMIDQAINISVDNNGQGNLTDGDPANTLVINVHYTVEEI